MRKLIALPAAAALIAGATALPAGASPERDARAGHGERAGQSDHKRGHRGGKPERRRYGRCDRERRRERGYTVIFDGTRKCFARWKYAGGASMSLRRDGTLRAGPGEPGLGVLWYAARPYADFSLRLQFRDDAPEGQRANSGVQVRFPPPTRPTHGCPTTFDGEEQDNIAWIAVNCGHEIQINDAPGGDPRKTGSIYGFADIGAEASRPTPPGVWNDLEITVVGQHYTIRRNGVVINEYENVPGVSIPGRPNDPDSSSRGPVGYVGLQSHGAPQDVVSFRNIRIRDLTAE